MKQQTLIRNRFLTILTISMFLAFGLVVGGTQSASLRSITQLTPNGEFAYVGNNGSQDVSIYSVNQDGALQPVGTVPADSGPQGIAVSPAMDPSPYAITAQAVYVVNEDSNTIVPYQINPGTGQLTPMGDPIPTGGSPQAIAIDPGGQMAIVANMGTDTISVYGVNPSNGGLTPMQTLPAGQDPVGVTVNPNNDMIYVTNQGSGNISVYSMNSGNGTVVPMGNVPMPSPPAGTPSGSPTAIDVLPGGNVAVATSPNNNSLGVFLVSTPNPIFNPTGLTPLVSVPTSNGGPSSIDIGPNGTAAVTIMPPPGKAQQGGFLTMFQITSGPVPGLRVLGVAPTGNGPVGVAFDPGGFAHVVNREDNTISSFAIMPGGLPMSLGSVQTGSSPEAVALAFR